MTGPRGAADRRTEGGGAEAEPKLVVNEIFGPT